MIEIIECPSQLYDQVFASIQAALNDVYKWQLEKLINEQKSS
jgi:hypothetical protein